MYYVSQLWFHKTYLYSQQIKFLKWAPAHPKSAILGHSTQVENNCPSCFGFGNGMF